jgi:hypothetical protein
MMNYTSPRIVSTVAANVAVKGVDKQEEPFDSGNIGTPAAYEADE